MEPDRINPPFTFFRNKIHYSEHRGKVVELFYNKKNKRKNLQKGESRGSQIGEPPYPTWSDIFAVTIGLNWFFDCNTGPSCLKVGQRYPLDKSLSGELPPYFYWCKEFISRGLVFAISISRYEKRALNFAIQAFSTFFDRVRSGCEHSASLISVNLQTNVAARYDRTVVI